MATCLQCGCTVARIKVSRVITVWDKSHILRLLECPECRRWYRQTITQEPGEPRKLGKEPEIIKSKK